MTASHYTYDRRGKSPPQAAGRSFLRAGSVAASATCLRLLANTIRKWRRSHTQRSPGSRGATGNESRRAGKQRTTIELVLGAAGIGDAALDWSFYSRGPVEKEEVWKVFPWPRGNAGNGAFAPLHRPSTARLCAIHIYFCAAHSGILFPLIYHCPSVAQWRRDSPTACRSGNERITNAMRCYHGGNDPRQELPGDFIQRKGT